MIALSDECSEFRNKSRLFDANAVQSATKALSDLVSQFEYLEETGELDSNRKAEVRLDVARRGLEILQKAVPELTAIANLCLRFAGGVAVREACAPIQRHGTDFNGKPLAPIPSPFKVPPDFETVPTKAKRAAHTTAVVATSLILGALGR